MKKTIFTVITIFTMFFFMNDVKAISCDYKIKVENQTIKITVKEVASKTTTGGGISKSATITLEDGTKVKADEQVKINGKRYIFEDEFKFKTHDKETVINYVKDEEKTRECENLSYEKKTNFGIKNDFTIKIGDSGKYNETLKTITNRVEDSNSDKENNGQNGNGSGLNANNDCESLLGEKTTKWLNWLLKIIQIAGPIIALILGMLDFVNAVLSSEDGAIKKAWGKFIRRIIAAIALIILPAIIDLILEATNITSNGTCGIK